MKGSHYTACPICCELFHRSLIERHAQNCGTKSTKTTTTTTSTTTATTTSSNNKSIPPKPPITTSLKSSMTSSSFGSLRPATSADLGPKRKRGLDLPSQEYAHLVVLDFEWTCDNKKPVLPHSEIIEFSCVLVSTKGRPSQTIAQFQQYVLPEHNPILSTFATSLTGITQKQIDYNNERNKHLQYAHGVMLI